MKISNILIMVLAAGALSAEDSPALDARIQMFVEQSRPAQVVVTQTPGVFKDQPGNQTGVGFRFMGELASAPGFYYELGGKLDSSSNFSSNSTIINLTDVKVTDNYWSLGAASTRVTLRCSTFVPRTATSLRESGLQWNSPV